jgi:hypothetical protein
VETTDPETGLTARQRRWKKPADARLAGRRKRHYTFARRSSPRFGQIGERTSRYKALIR